MDYNRRRMGERYMPEEYRETDGMRPRMGREPYYERGYDRGYEPRGYMPMERDFRHGDYRDYGEPYFVTRMGYEREHGRRDYGEPRLTPDEIMEWKRSLKNHDGSTGEHFPRDLILRVAEQAGVKYNGYDESELCMAVNMLYSDYEDVVKLYVPSDKEPMFYVKMAKSFLEDADAPIGSEKLALYYDCIARNGK